MQSIGSTANFMTAKNQNHPNYFATVGDPSLKRSFKGHKDAITGICFNPNLKQVVSSSIDGTVMVWNFKQ